MASFKILIIGGGLGGLACATALSQAGHKVTLLESTSKLQTIGGGISIPPNSMRVFEHLSLIERLRDVGEADKRPAVTHIRRYDDGKVLCDVEMKEGFGYEHLNMHRAPLQKLLMEAATEKGTTIHTNARVVEIDESGPSPVATTRTGEKFEADIIIGADGAKSTVRSHMYPDIELSSNINCYRVVIDGDVLRRDENLAHLLDESNGWWGPDRVAIGLPVQSGTFYSLELTHPGTTGTAGDWSKRGDVNRLRETYADFEPVIVKLLAYVKSEDLLVWKLVQLPELETWVGKSGKVVLVADAAHAHMPFSGQGHAMAMEDGVSLALCLSRCSSVADIPHALQSFEAIRKPRTKMLATHAKVNAHLWQLSDGEEQQKRDEMMKHLSLWSSAGWDGKHVDDIPESPMDASFNAWVLGHDVVDFTNRRLDELWESTYKIDKD